MGLKFNPTNQPYYDDDHDDLTFMLVKANMDIAFLKKAIGVYSIQDTYWLRRKEGIEYRT